MSSPGVRIYVVDDDPLLGSGIVGLLAAAGYEAQAFGSGKAFLATYPQLPPGCIVVDLLMQEIGGLELQRRLIAAGCRWPVIVLTGHSNRTDAARAMEAGAISFLEKPVREIELLAAVLKGQAFLRGSADPGPDPELVRRLASLAPRERAVLECLSSDKKLNKQIAAVLGISENTVKGYRKIAMKKMGAKNSTELVLLALRAGFVAKPRSMRV
jgi:two-component system, LuxR family, response regulator FixJ